jgi:ArsR family transcriptional regulator
MSTQLRPVLPVRHRSEPCCTPTKPPALDVRETARLADMLKSVGDPTRLGMLDLLAQQPEPLCVCDITPRFRQNQPTISHHLKILREARLIDTEKRGLWAYYWATDDGRKLLSALQRLT